VKRKDDCCDDKVLDFKEKGAHFIYAPDDRGVDNLLISDCFAVFVSVF